MLSSQQQPMLSSLKDQRNLQATLVHKAGRALVLIHLPLRSKTKHVLWH